jgi:glycosyltransferase involved in cell wall biosynthesis
VKILFVSAYLPHAKAGHGTASLLHDLIKGLVAQHEITYLTFCNDDERRLIPTLGLPIELIIVERPRGAPDDPLGVALLACRRVFQFLLSLIRWEPYFVAKYRSRRMREEVERVTSAVKFDVVVVELTQMGHFVHSIKSGKSVWHEIDVSFRPAYRRYAQAKSAAKFASRISLCRWYAFESRIARAFDLVMPLTRQDARLITYLSGIKQADYLPCSVEAPVVFPPYAVRASNTVLFVGSFTHHPNRDAAMWLAEEIFPFVQREVAGAELRIVGGNPPAELVEAAKKNPAIRMLGFVDLVGKELQQCAVFAAPMRYGGGIKVKVVSALAQGIPIVTTNIGAEGLETMNGTHLLNSHTAAGIAAQIAALLKDRQRAEAIGRAGWQLARDEYSTEAVVRRFEKICSRLTA